MATIGSIRWNTTAPGLTYIYILGRELQDDAVWRTPTYQAEPVSSALTSNSCLSKQVTQDFLEHEARDKSWHQP